MDDEVINFTLGIIQKQHNAMVHAGRRPKCIAFPSFFYAKLAGGDRQSYCYERVARWTFKNKGIDVFEYDRIIVPINLNNWHWTCVAVRGALGGGSRSRPTSRADRRDRRSLAIIDLEQKTINYLDSSGDKSNGHGIVACGHLRKWLFDEAKVRAATPHGHA